MKKKSEKIAATPATIPNHPTQRGRTPSESAAAATAKIIDAIAIPLPARITYDASPAASISPLYNLMVVGVVAHRLDAGRDPNLADAGGHEDGASHRDERRQERPVRRVRPLGERDALAHRSATQSREKHGASPVSTHPMLM